MKDINTDAVAKGLAAKDYIAQSQASTTLPEDVVPILTNPLDWLNKLVNLAPANEYFAANAITTSLGYSVITSLLFAWRKEMARPNIEAPTIDIFNDGFADKYEQRANSELTETNGHYELPIFDASSFKGIYKQMLQLQRGNTLFAAKYPVRMPHEILHEMQTNDRTLELNKAYAELEAKLISGSPAAAAINAERTRAKARMDEATVRRNKLETDHVLGELQKAAPDQLTDSKWHQIPLYVQYKYTTYVYRQAIKALVQETNSRERDTDVFDQLLDIVNTIHLELEGAARSPEVKAAFAQDRLDERHELVRASEETKAKDESDTKSETRFQRAPRPEGK